MNDILLVLKLIAAAIKLRLSDHSKMSFDSLNKSQDYIEILEQVALRSPNTASQIAKSLIAAFDRGLNKTGFDLASLIDSDDEIWLEIQHLDDPLKQKWVRKALNLRERLRTIALSN